ncbi:MAG: hypothetical protein IJU91_05205, partial [Selenomonadaceae bacterium]|nr:hypothetical protein [Selenomonadaceae bacterium]
MTLCAKKIIIAAKFVEDIFMDNDFEILKIDAEIFSRIDGKSYKKNCTVPIENLRYLRVLH